MKKPSALQQLLDLQMELAAARAVHRRWLARAVMLRAERSSTELMRRLFEACLAYDEVCRVQAEVTRAATAATTEVLRQYDALMARTINTGV